MTRRKSALAGGGGCRYYLRFVLPCPLRPLWPGRIEKTMTRTPENIRDDFLDRILNTPRALDFRRRLKVKKNSVCRRCVCPLYLR